MSAPREHEPTAEGREPLPPSIFERHVGRIVNGVYAICALLLVADVVFHFVGDKHVHFDIESWPGFYALVGFVSYVGLVLSAKQLRKLVKRPEDYYGLRAPFKIAHERVLEPEEHAQRPSPTEEEE